MGSDVNPSNLTFSDNLIYQLRPILSDKTNSRINPGYYAHVWIAGYLDGSIVCIYNITISDGAIGLRLSGMNQTTVDSCVNNTLLPGFFDDGLDFLRRIYYYNPNITGAFRIAYNSISQEVRSGLEGRVARVRVG